MKLYIFTDDAYALMCKVARTLTNTPAAEIDNFKLAESLRDVLDGALCEEVKEATIVQPPPPAAKPVLKPALYFPNIIKLCNENNIKLYLDGCKVHKTLAGRFCLVSPTYGGGYFGTFDEEGYFRPNNTCKKEFIAQLQAVEERGLEAVKEISALTGHCCVCNRLLTNETSIEEGIGPICAGKFNGYGV